MDRGEGSAIRAVAWRLAPALVPGLLMLGLGLTGSTRPVLSWDEIATADVARRTPGQIWHLVHHIDGVFAPYYLAMHAWTSVAGDSVLSLRLPSVLAMAGAVAVTGELGGRLFEPRVGMVAGILAATLPNLSRYAAEARPYAMACFFSTLALLTLYRLLDRPAWQRWLGYGAAVAAAGLSHVVTLALLGAHLVILIIRLRGTGWRRMLPGWAATIGVVLLVLLPLLWWGVRQRQTQLYWVPPVSAGGIYTFPSRLIGSTQVAWLLIGLLLVAMSGRRRELAEILTSAAVPLLTVLAVSAAGPSFWVVRYLLYVLMPGAIAAAAGLVYAGRELPPRLAAARLPAVLAVVAAASVPGQVTVRGPTVKNGADYRTVAHIVRSRQAPADVIVYQKGRTMRAGVGYYLRTDRDRPRDPLVAASAAEIGSLTAREVPDPGVRLAGAPRIWLVVGGRPADPATARRDLTTLLRDRYRRTGQWTVKQATVALYVAR